MYNEMRTNTLNHIDMFNIGCAWLFIWGSLLEMRSLELKILC